MKLRSILGRIKNISFKDLKAISLFLFDNSNEFTSNLKKLIRASSSIRYPESQLSVFERIQPFEGGVIYHEKSPVIIFKTYIKAILMLFALYRIEDLERSYGRLSDEYSKKLFLSILSYKLFDVVRVRFPLYESEAWNRYKKYDEMICSDETFKVDVLDFHLFDLNSLGMDIKLFNSHLGTFIDFDLEQYKYKDLIQTNDGDVVIDGGACTGDTALYFSNKAGESGHVHSFEFIESNISVFQKNMDLNPQLSKNITLIDRPLGSNSDNILYAIGSGPAARITDIKPDGVAKEYRSISIDEYVEKNNISKVDYIKLDIEGSELDTLQGAVKTIKRFKPKLAICVYHKHSDLWEIPDIIKDTVPEYNLYLDHFTTTIWETVMFAKVPN